jgi:hypothetical protein
MGRRGPPPLPPEVHKLRGTLRPDRHRTAAHQPAGRAPAGPAPLQVPPWLRTHPAALQAFKAIAARPPHRHFEACDSALVAVYCLAGTHILEMLEAASKAGDLLCPLWNEVERAITTRERLGDELGLTVRGLERLPP